MVVAAFIAPYLLEATARFVTAAAELPGVRLGVITAQRADELPEAVRWHADAHWQVADPLDPRQLADAVTGLGRQLGRVERLVGALEQLQVPLAQVREALGIEGMDVPTALNVRDKSRMKTVLGNAGIPCARHQLVHAASEALSFAEAVGFPIVAKPPAGAGSQATYRLDDMPTMRAWLEVLPPRREDPALLEEFLVGDEHTYDSVSIDGQTVWASIADYLPPPLEVLRNPWMQWVVLLRRDISGPDYADIHRVGPEALRALGVQDALTHMEWFRRPDGSVAVSEVAARPPGAQLSTMHGLAHEFDFYRAWAELVVLGTFDPPARRYATGTAYLRGAGRGRVQSVHGIDELQRELGHLVVDARLPRPGQPASTDYLGEGWVTVRDPDTDVVRDALQRIVSTARVELVEAL